MYGQLNIEALFLQNGTWAYMVVVLLVAEPVVCILLSLRTSDAMGSIIAVNM